MDMILGITILDSLLEPVYDLCIKVILTQRKSDETFLPK